MERLTVSRPPMAAGLVWLKQGWQLVKAWIVPWMGMTAAAFLALYGIGLLPKLGGLIVEVLSPFMVAGFMSASRAAERGEPVTFLHLGAGFDKSRVQALLVIGALYAGCGLLIGLAMQKLGGHSLQDLMRLAQDPAALSPEATKLALDRSLPAVLLGLVLYTPLLMATWFAPALILYRDFSPLNALWWSLWTCFVNWRPILYYSLIMGLIGAVAMLIPFGLGLLVFLPWAMTSTYIAYTQQFVAVRAEPPSVDEHSKAV